MRTPKTGETVVSGPDEAEPVVVPAKKKRKGKARAPRTVDAFKPAAPKVEVRPAADGKLAGAYAQFQGILGAVVDTGTWRMLDGTTPPWKERPLLDVAGRFSPLSMDPARGKVSPGSVEEAAIGLAAERAGVVPAPLTREATGMAEFVDAEGKFWDVKSPVSPWAGAKWKFDVAHQVEKVKHDIHQDNTVLLNLSRVTPEDAATLLQTLRAQLTPAEVKRVVTLTTPEVLSRE